MAPSDAAIEAANETRKPTMPTDSNRLPDPAKPSEDSEVTQAKHTELAPACATYYSHCTESEATHGDLGIGMPQSRELEQVPSQLDGQESAPHVLDVHQKFANSGKIGSGQSAILEQNDGPERVTLFNVPKVPFTKPDDTCENLRVRQSTNTPAPYTTQPKTFATNNNTRFHGRLAAQTHWTLAPKKITYSDENYWASETHVPGTEDHRPLRALLKQQTRSRTPDMPPTFTSLLRPQHVQKIPIPSYVKTTASNRKEPTVDDRHVQSSSELLERDPWNACNSEVKTQSPVKSQIQLLGNILKDTFNPNNIVYRVGYVDDESTLSLEESGPWTWYGGESADIPGYDAGDDMSDDISHLVHTGKQRNGRKVRRIFLQQLAKLSKDLTPENGEVVLYPYMRRLKRDTDLDENEQLWETPMGPMRVKWTYWVIVGRTGNGYMAAPFAVSPPFHDWSAEDGAAAFPVRKTRPDELGDAGPKDPFKIWSWQAWQEHSGAYILFDSQKELPNIELLQTRKGNIVPWQFHRFREIAKRYVNWTADRTTRGANWAYPTVTGLNGSQDMRQLLSATTGLTGQVRNTRLGGTVRTPDQGEEMSKVPPGSKRPRDESVSDGKTIAGKKTRRSPLGSQSWKTVSDEDNVSAKTYVHDLDDEPEHAYEKDKGTSNSPIEELVEE
ncbi:hypothetical protein K491DRAFT_682445 [Lophiostoma macrostomum CBS 122681]|uniref:Uncharacterized protein n=1 Tax=Lophiostoma macrostomum CBS 122681 TaxID=1314788 RepID=A0A6A6SVR1_9PLEO|nr:hypothetical protein K491DRAFT_682445 [Lophiostoma macrostomum CBS 122681]